MTREAVTTEAFVLRTVAYRDADLIVTLLTHDLGKIGALARGARSSRRRFGGALEPFARLEVVVEPDRRGLHPLVEARSLEVYDGLARVVGRITAASFVLELVRELLAEHVPERAVFDFVAESLSLLAAADEKAIPPLRIAAELRALSLAGVEVSLDRCNACGTKVPENRSVLFNPSRGGVVCTPCGGGPLALSKTAVWGAIALARSPLNAASMVELDDKERAAIDTALDGFRSHHLGRRLDSARLRDVGTAASPV